MELSGIEGGSGGCGVVERWGGVHVRPSIDKVIGRSGKVIRRCVIGHGLSVRLLGLLLLEWVLVLALVLVVVVLRMGLEMRLMRWPIEMLVVLLVLVLMLVHDRRRLLQLRVWRICILRVVVVMVLLLELCLL